MELRQKENIKKEVLEKLENGTGGKGPGEHMGFWVKNQLVVGEEQEGDQPDLPSLEASYTRNPKILKRKEGMGERGRTLAQRVRSQGLS